MNPDADDGGIDLRAFYRDQLRGNLESLPFNRDYALLVDELVAFLQQAHVQVRYYRGAFLHAKAYLLPHYGIVGSSNFTPAGMTRKAELNLVQKQGAVVRELRKEWYERMWAYSVDSKADMIVALEQSKFGDAPWTPHDVFIKLLNDMNKERQ